MILIKGGIRHVIVLAFWCGLLFLLADELRPRESAAEDETLSQSRRVNAPFLGGSPAPPFTPAIFWFGEITPISNYADVRTYYHETHLEVIVHIIDRLLWYDTTPDASDMDAWDAVSLYLDLDGNVGSVPDANAFRFLGQLNNWEPDQQWRKAFRGDGVGWAPDSLAFTTDTWWRGNYPNDNTDDHGWSITFDVPFKSLGLPGRPAAGTTWGMALALHDRDDSNGTPIAARTWPEAMDADLPGSWGILRFGPPPYSVPVGFPTGELLIRQGLNSSMVVDAHIGGHTTCGSGVGFPWYSNWGMTNYAGYPQVNVQNQWDISDWPCFSKYYVTFPLQDIPPGQTILMATLTMYQFGSSYGQGVEPSWIQVLTVGDIWDEQMLTWNNAPLALENITGTWVNALNYVPAPPGIRRNWTLSGPVAEAYASGKPLRLALYSGDGAYHSGRYFWSSDTEEWNAQARPTLHVVWGKPCGSVGVYCAYLPVTRSDK